MEDVKIEKDPELNLSQRYTPCNICLINDTNLINLSCHHSFCNKCIHQHLIYNFHELTTTKSTFINLKCIICQKSQHSITKLDLLKFLTGNQQKLSNEQEHLQYCKDHHGKKIEHYCDQCKCIMCSDCLIKHNNLQLLKFHNVTENISSLSMNIYSCARHENKKFKYQCMACDTPICSICFVLNHSSHKVKFISEYFDQVREEILSKKIPYENYSDFKEKIKKQQQEIFVKIKKDSYKIYDLIQNLTNKLENLKSEYKIKLDELENNQIINQEILTKTFEKLFQDFNQLKIQKSNPNFNLKENFFKYEKLKMMQDIEDSIVFDVNVIEKIPDYIISIDNNLEKIKFQISNIKEVYNKNNLSKSDLKFKKSSNLYYNTNCKYQEEIQLEKENILETNNINCLTKYNFMSNSNYFSRNKKRNSQYDFEKKIQAHSKKINSIIILKSKHTSIATCSEDGEIKFFNENLKLIRTINAHEGEITSLMEHQSENLISTGKDKLLKLWIKIENSRSNYFNLASFLLPAPIIHLILINTENFAVALTNGSIKIIHFKNNMFYDLGTNLYWENNSVSVKNFSSNKIVSTYSNLICVTSQKYLVWGNSLGSIKVWYRDNLYSTDTSDYTSVYSNKYSTMLNDHTDHINKLIGIDSNRFISCSGDCKIIVWSIQYKQLQNIMNPSQSQKIFNRNLKFEPTSLANININFDFDDSFDIKLKRENPNTCSENFKIKKIQSQIQSRDFTGMYLTTFSRFFLNGHRESVDYIEIMRNGKLVSLSCTEIRLWDLENYTCIKTVVDNYERCILNKRIEDNLIIMANYNGLRIYELKIELKLIKNLIFENNYDVSDVKITLNKELLVGYESGEICKWSNEVFIPQK